MWTRRNWVAIDVQEKTSSPSYEGRCAAYVLTCQQRSRYMESLQLRKCAAAPWYITWESINHHLGNLNMPGKSWKYLDTGLIHGIGSQMTRWICFWGVHFFRNLPFCQFVCWSKLANPKNWMVTNINPGLINHTSRLFIWRGTISVANYHCLGEPQ